MKFNKDQLNGIATILDNVGTAIIIAIVVALFIESKIQSLTASALLVLAIANITVAFFIRGAKKNE